MADPKHVILARRAKFVAAAVASAGLVTACSSHAEACLSLAQNDTGAVDGTADGSSTDTGSTDTGPTPCLTPVEDTGTRDASDGGDTGPTPCLDVAIDSGTADSDGGGG